MGQTIIKEIPSALLVEQQMFMRGFAELETRPYSYSIVTYGCQMNERDSETIAGMFKEMDMEEAVDRESADLVIFNPDEEWIFDKSVSKSQNTPFLGEKLPGKIHFTICKGKVVYSA